jgi:hypothetical protein
MGLDIPPLAEADAEIRLGGIVSALSPDGRPMAPVQLETVRAMASELWGVPLLPERAPPVSPERLAEALPAAHDRERVVQLMVTLELLLHPLPKDVSRNVCRYADALGVNDPSVAAARRLAHNQAVLMYACIQRNSWYPAETRRGMRDGHLYELVRSKLAYYAVARDTRIEARWRGLGDLPEGTWGRGVFEFYVSNRFPFPGERHGIYEVGARHDWVHVLTDYGTTPEGEIDVFAFIAASLPDPQGFVLLVVTLGIFQNGSIRHMFGRRVPTARLDTMSEPGAPQRFAEALRRGRHCGVDVLGMDHFAAADEPLESVRRRLGVAPRSG